MPENEKSTLESEQTEQETGLEATDALENTEQLEQPDDEEQEETENGTDEKNRLFTMRFRIPLEDYYQFHLIMGRDTLSKGKRKTQLLGLVEFVFGVIFLISLFTTDTQASGFYYFIIAVLIIMGAYGMLYHKYFYEKSLRRAVVRQYEKVPYLQNEIVIDFYPNKLVEHVQDQHVETFWHTIQEIRISEGLYMIMLAERRCLLVPKSSAGEQKEQFEALLAQVCENYEKPRCEV